VFWKGFKFCFVDFSWGIKSRQTPHKAASCLLETASRKAEGLKIALNFFQTTRLQDLLNLSNSSLNSSGFSGSS
jgi:hypothetical protein